MNVPPSGARLSRAHRRCVHVLLSDRRGSAFPGWFSFPTSLEAGYSFARRSTHGCGSNYEYVRGEAKSVWTHPGLWISLHLSAFSPTRLISHSSEHWDAGYTILCSVELNTAALASKCRFGFVRMRLLNSPTAHAEMRSQSTVAKSRKFQIEHKCVLRLAQSDVLLHSSCTYTLRGSTLQVCGLCVQYKTAVNPERRGIVVFSVLSTHMDKCTWCLGGRVSVAANPNIMGVWYLAQRHLSSGPSPLLLPAQWPFLWGSTGTPKRNPVCSNTFWVWIYFTITEKGPKPVITENTELKLYVYQARHLLPEGSWDTFQPLHSPSKGWSSRRWMDGCIKQASKVNLNVKVLILGALIRGSPHQWLLIRTATMSLVYLSTDSHEEAAVSERMTHAPSGALLCELAGQSQQTHSPALSHAPAAQPEFHVFTSGNCLIVCNA